MRHTVVLAALACLVSLLSLSRASAQDAEQGARLFAFHCAICHGAEAKGNGPEAPSLNPQPKDLTALAKENGGTFPTLMVLRRIDGREAIVAHGSPMPVFGGFFDGPTVIRKTEAGQPVEMTKPVADLVAWLMSVQAE